MLNFRRFRYLLSLATLCLCFSEARSARPPIREAPKILDGTDLGVGRTISDLTWTDVNGTSDSLSRHTDAKAVVFLMTTTSCPLCLRYAPSLARIEQDYTDRGIDFVFVNPNPAEKADRIQKSISTHGFQGPYVRDTDRHIIRGLQARTTTEAFVVDADRRLIYRGAVDDQYGFGYSRNEPRHTYLRDALDAVLNGTRPKVSATSAPGCELWLDDEDEQ